MASLDSLAADQRAVIELILVQGRSYDEIARLLSIDRTAVRDRALAALDALGPPSELPPLERALITDYLLGQLPSQVAEDLRDRLNRSPAEGAWARERADALKTVANGRLPDLAEPATAGAPPPPDNERTDSTTPPERAAPEPRTGAELPRSRVGGAILLGVGGLIAAGVVVLLVVLLSNGSSSDNAPHQSTASTVANTGTTTHPITSTTRTSTTAAAHVVEQINLKPPDTGSKALGVAQIVQENKNTGVAIVAQGLAANATHPANAYAVWLYNTPTDSYRLGFVNPPVSRNGQLRTAGLLPATADHYKNLIVTLETQANPRVPGKIVLRGPITHFS